MSKRKVTGKVLVIQLGREETQIALMAPGSGILASSTVDTPMGAVEDGLIRNTDAVRGMLKNALNAPDFKRVRKAIFVLSTSQVISEQITTPKLTGKKLEKVIQANIDEYFPVDTQDYQLVWQPIGPAADEGMQSVQLWAVPQSLLGRYYGVANDCGLSLEAVDYCGHAIATAMGASFAQPALAGKPKKKKGLPNPYEEAYENRNTADTEVFISLEKDLLGMTFVQKNQVVMQRFLQCGGDPTYQFAELSMMVEYFRSSAHGRGTDIRGKAIGSLASDRNMLQELVDMLGIELYLENSMDPRWVLCQGAADCDLDFGIPSLNKPGKAKQEVKSQLWQYGLLLGSGLAVVAVFMFLLNARLGWSTQLGILQASQQALTLQSAKTAGFADNYKNYETKYNAYSQDWDAIFANLRTYNDNLVLVLEELESIMPVDTEVENLPLQYQPTYRGTPRDWITALEIYDSAMRVTFACEDKATAAYLIMQLRYNMKYVNLIEVTDLKGGGSGAATEYAGEGDKEAAPTEGGVELTDAMKKQLVNLVAGSLDGDTIMDVAISLSPEQVELVEEVYGNFPNTTYSRLVAFKSDKGPDKVTLLRRQNAINALLTTNYFAMYNFFNMLGEDIYRDEPYVWNHIQGDMMKPENQDIWAALISGSVDDAKTLNQYAKRVVAMLVKDEETTTATEELLCTSSKMERWYIYYLEVELGMQPKEDFPYLNVEKAIYDLQAGGFNTGDEYVDGKLNSLIPESAWKLLDMLGKPEDKDDLLGGLTEDEMLKVLKTFIEKGGDTGNAAQNALVNKVIQQYIDQETTGYKKLDAAILDYLKNGTPQKPSDTETPKEDYIIGNYTKEKLTLLLDLYLKNGTTKPTGTDQEDQLMYQIVMLWSQNGSTGIAKLDTFLKDYFKDDDLSDLLGSLQGGGSGTGQPTDTRIYFVATLAYSDALLQAELERKGLDYSNKIDKLEWEVAE